MNTEELLDEVMKVKPEERFTLPGSLIESLGGCPRIAIVARARAG